jgi:hypothetical protein
MQGIYLALWCFLKLRGGLAEVLSCRRLTASYISFMTTSVTIRMSTSQRDKLRQKAKLLGKTESAFIREVLDRETEPRTMGERIGHLKGTLSFKGVKLEGWRKTIYEHNWRS